MLGIALDVLTFVVARYGPSGGDVPWSFRGNGALIVPLGLGPAILAGGWTAVLLHGRRGVRWLTWGVTVFAIGALLVLLHRQVQVDTLRHALAQAAFTVSGLVGFVAAEQVLPPGS